MEVKGTNTSVTASVGMQPPATTGTIKSKPIWRIRMLCEKHYGSRLAYMSGFLYRNQIIQGVQHVGLSAKLDYHHYLKKGFTMVPVDITVTTTPADLYGILIRSIEKLQDQDLIVSVPLVFQKELATALFTRENLRRWGRCLRFKFIESNRNHEKGMDYFENRRKITVEGTSCEEQIVVIRYGRSSIGYYECFREIVMRSTEYMFTKPEKFPNLYPFWKLEQDEKTTAKFRYYYTRTKAEMPWTARQLQMLNGTYRDRKGTTTNTNNQQGELPVENKEADYDEPEMNSFMVQYPPSTKQNGELFPLLKARGWTVVIPE